MKNHSMGLLAAAVVMQSGAMAANWCDTIKSKTTVQLATGEVVFYSKDYDVDADGAPNAYLVNGKGLSFVCDGVSAVENGRQVTTDMPGWQEKCNAAWKKAKETDKYDPARIKIFGFLTNSDNRPLIQKEGEPLPKEAYISTTSIHIPDGKVNTQNYYVDSTKIPYVVLSSSFLKKYQVKAGSIVLVYRPATAKLVPAVFADSGGLGEGSLKLHELLGNDPYIRNYRGSGVTRAKKAIGDPVITMVIPAVRTTPTVNTLVWLKEIEGKGQNAVDRLGGLAKVKACLDRAN